MMADDRAELPHNFHVRVGDALGEFLRARTVPVFVFRGTPSAATREPHFSAVPFRARGRYFLLTAAHCVAALADPALNAQVSAFERSFHLWPLALSGATHGAVDYGVIEISAELAEHLVAEGRVFVEEDALQLESAAVLEQSKERFALAGYPEAIGTYEATYSAVKLLHLVAPIARLEEEEVPDNPPAEPGDQLIRLRISRDDAFRPDPDEPTPTFVPRLSSASGGGVWCLNQWPEPHKWTPEACRLVAIHHGSTEHDFHHPELGPTVYTRATLLTHHLSLID